MDIFLQSAINEAKKSFEKGGIPIGAVLALNNELISSGHNKRVQNSDPMAHAEIDCLRNAGRVKNYKDTILYSTLMPCYLCAGAVVQFGIKKVVVGEARTFAGAEQFMKDHGVEIIDLDNKECFRMMQNFIKKNPQLWNEDIGK